MLTDAMGHVLIGPQNRAPLGLKTTNAKARPLQTPVAKDGWDKEKNSTVQGSATARKTKPKPAHVETTNFELEADDDGELEEREIEYMPRKPIGEICRHTPIDGGVTIELMVLRTDLPDVPEDIIPPNIDYSVLRGENLTRGWYTTYFNPIGDDGLSLMQRQLQERHRKLDEEANAQILKSLDEIDLSAYYNDDEEDGPLAMKEASRTKGPSKEASVQAADLLSKKPDVTDSSRRPVTAKQDAKSRSGSRLPLSFGSRMSSKKAPLPATSTGKPSETHHATAVTASKTTLGYTKGRVASRELAKAGSARLGGVYSRASSRATATTTSTSKGIDTRTATKTAKTPAVSGPPSTVRRVGPAAAVNPASQRVQGKQRLDDNEKQGTAKITDTTTKPGLTRNTSRQGNAPLRTPLFPTDVEEDEDIDESIDAFALALIGGDGDDDEEEVFQLPMPCFDSASS